MNFLQNMTFNLGELAALLGFGQTLLILVHLFSRLEQVKISLPYILFFSVLCGGFASGLLYRLEDYEPHVRLLSWTLWAFSVPAGILMILSILRPGVSPSFGRYFVYAPVPLALVLAYITIRTTNVCTDIALCPNSFDVYLTFGMVAQTLCFLFLFRGGFTRSGFLSSDYSSERYWLTVALVAVILAVIASTYAFLTEHITFEDMGRTFTIIGLLFVYLTSTLIFRIYPPVLALKPLPQDRPPLSPQDREIRNKIEKLMRLDKLYQEPSFGRSDLARELELPEGQVSTIVNRAFNMNLSHYINGYRVREAQYMLKNSDLPVAEISNLTGFNALASFNRVFKDMTGLAPTAYRKKHAKL